MEVWEREREKELESKPNRPKPSNSIPADLNQKLVQSKYNKDNVGVKLDGEYVTLNPVAKVINGSMFIPLRGVFEKMGAEMKWAQKE